MYLRSIASHLYIEEKLCDLQAITYNEMLCVLYSKELYWLTMLCGVSGYSLAL